MTEQQLRELFEVHGTILTITMVKDRDTGGARGIAFVDMKEATEDQGAGAFHCRATEHPYPATVPLSRLHAVDAEVIIWISLSVSGVWDDNGALKHFISVGELG